VVAGFSAGGIVVAGVIVATLAGMVVPVAIPARYLATFAGQ
jgi:hypothetical protein